MRNKELYLYKIELFELEQFICIKMDLALNNLEWLMYHKTKPNQTKANTTFGSRRTKNL